jgi:molybdenum cofactor biosynthesis enzyme
LIYDENGKGVLIGTSKSTAKAETVKVKGKTVVDREVLSESVVRLTPALIKRLQVEYGVEIPIAQPAQPAAQAPDPLGIL